MYAVVMNNHFSTGPFASSKGARQGDLATLLLKFRNDNQMHKNWR